MAKAPASKPAVSKPTSPSKSRRDGSEVTPSDLRFMRRRLKGWQVTSVSVNISSLDGPDTIAMLPAIPGHGFVPSDLVDVTVTIRPHNPKRGLT